MPRSKMFTIFDMMENRGVFSSNPNNAQSVGTDGSPLYRGPTKFPKMLYHPKGEQRISVPAEEIVTPFGPKRVNEQKELISLLVNDPEEESKALAAGWHTHPAKAIAARLQAEGGDMSTVPAMSSEARMRDLEAEIERLKAERTAMLGSVQIEPKSDRQTLFATPE